MAWRGSIDYPNDLVDAHVSLERIDAGFSPTLGFVSRAGIQSTSGHVSFGPRPSSHFLGIRQFDLKFPIPDWDITASEHGSLARAQPGVAVTVPIERVRKLRADVVLA